MGDLDNVKVGDALAEVHGVGFSGRGLRKHIVTDVHKLHVLTMDGARVLKWKKLNGFLVGSEGYYARNAEPWTKRHDGLKVEIAADEERKKKIQELENANWRELGTEIVNAAYALLPRPKEIK